MSLSPKDMDFIEAKHVAAREIALALGVPPMLLGIPGDNTYSNYQEANRSFWRLTVLPLVARTAKALSAWLAPAYDAPLELRPDLDAIDALSPERDALWSRLEKTTFLTSDEKRTAIGYAPLGDTPFAADLKFRPDQSRDDHGRWTDEGEGQVLPAADRGEGFKIDLREEQDRGGHPVSEHVGKSEEYLRRRLDEYVSGLKRRDDFGGISMGTFPSIDAANKLVNSALSDSAGAVAQVASGERSDAILEKWFASPTGFEVFLPSRYAQPYRRDTYGLRVYIVRDPASVRGFRVQSAFPIL